MVCMTVQLLDSGRFLVEELYEFPRPEVALRAVSDYGDLKYLSIAPEAERSVIYFYADRNTRSHLISYTGQTKDSIQSRYNATHSKAPWLHSLDAPLIGACESRTTPWSTDTRLAIEGSAAYKMRERGFQIVNSENKTWANGGEIRFGVNRALVEGVAELIVRHQLAWLGLPLLAPAEEAAEAVEAAQVEEVERKEPLPMETLLWKHPKAGRKLIVKTKRREVHGEQTADGLVLLTSALGIPASPQDYTNQGTKDLHARLLQEGERQPDGTYRWQGRTEPARPTVWLGAAFGKGMNNIWREV